MKKLLILLFLVCLVSCNELKDKTMTVYRVAECGESVAVRKKPSRDSEIMAELSPGQELSNVDEAGEWYVVAYGENWDDKGYVPAKFIVSEEVVLTKSEILSKEYNQKVTPPLIEKYRLISSRYLEVFPLKKCPFWVIMIIAIVVSLIASAMIEFPGQDFWLKLLFLLICLPFLTWVSFSLYENGLEFRNFWLRLISMAALLVTAFLFTYAVYSVFVPYIMPSYLKGHLFGLAITVFLCYLAVAFLHRQADRVLYVASAVFAFRYFKCAWLQAKYMSARRKWWQSVFDFCVFLLLLLVFNVYVVVMLVPLQVISSIMIVELLQLALLISVAFFWLDGALSSPLNGGPDMDAEFVGYDWQTGLTEKSDGYFYDSDGKRYEKIDGDTYRRR